MSISLPSGSISLDKDSDAPTTDENEYAKDLKNPDVYEQETPLEAAATRQAILAIPGVTADVEASNIYIVGWDGPDDKTNPLNGAPVRRWGTICLISLITLITYVPIPPLLSLLTNSPSPLASAMFAPAVPTLMKEFHVQSSLLSSLVVSIFILGFVFGPLLCSPLSELYGRLPVYHGSNIMFFIFSLACALAPNLPALIVFRFLAGCAGSAALAIGGGTIADVIHIHHRGKAMVLFNLGPILGPVIGPVGGGFAVQSLGWRWIFWIIAILSGAVTLLCLVVMRETFAPRILGLKTAKLQKEYPNAVFRSKYYTGLKPSAYLTRSLFRPLRMLVNPIVLALSLYLAVAYGYLYLLFTTFTLVFQKQYGFSLGAAGLAFLGSGVGSIIGAAMYASCGDKILKHLSKNTGPKPEYRLPAMGVGAVFLPIGLFIYGWTAEKKVHWMLPMVGTGFFGVAIVLVFVSSLAPRFHRLVLITTIIASGHELPRRHLRDLRRLLSGRQHGPPLPRRCVPTTRRRGNV